jgi:hypothetical protein
VGKDLQQRLLPSALALTVMASLGVVSNLQVTSPLLLVALRDVLLKALGADPSQLLQQRLCTTAIVLLAAGGAWSLSKDFAAVCGLVGSFATIVNSIVMPICFYHSAMQGRYPAHRKAAHAALLAMALLCALAGIGSELCEILHIRCPAYLLPHI